MYHIRYIVSVALASLIFFVSTGVTIDFHYCQGYLKSFSLYGKAKSCHEQGDSEDIPTCPHHAPQQAAQEVCNLDEKDCCSNRTVLIQSDFDQFIKNIESVVSEAADHPVVHIVLTTGILSMGESVIGSLAHYKPPLLFRDIPVLVQSFLF